MLCIITHTYVFNNFTVLTHKQTSKITDKQTKSRFNEICRLLVSNHLLLSLNAINYFCSTYFTGKHLLKQFIVSRNVKFKDSMLTLLQVKWCLLFVTLCLLSAKYFDRLVLITVKTTCYLFIKLYEFSLTVVLAPFMQQFCVTYQLPVWSGTKLIVFDN